MIMCKVGLCLSSTSLESMSLRENAPEDYLSSACTRNEEGKTEPVWNTLKKS